MLFADGAPDLPLYFGASLVSWRPCLMCSIMSIGIPFLYIVVHMRVQLIVSNAFDRSISRILASRLAFSMYCSTLMMEPIVDIPSL